MKQITVTINDDIWQELIKIQAERTIATNKKPALGLIMAEMIEENINKKKKATS
jgi:predicted CopG family antitoxin